jgi:hypothetical protein
MPRKIIASNACLVMFLVCTNLLQADDSTTIRKPLGVYAHVDITEAIQSYSCGNKPCHHQPTPEQLHSYLRGLYAGLLANQAISGLTVGIHWDQIQKSGPACVFSHSCAPGTEHTGGYDFSYLDDVFAEVKANPDRKSVQLIITPGVDSPPWLLANIPSCDGLFSPTQQAPADCGTVTLSKFPQDQRSDPKGGPWVIPLPWNWRYKLAWYDFLGTISGKYGSNPAFVAIAVAGPISASTEMILPTTRNGSFQNPNEPADQAWIKLIAHSFPPTSSYQNSDQVFVDQWKEAIDVYESIFAGVTLFLSPDAGQDLPELPADPSKLFHEDCSTTPSPMSCEAKAEILSYFVTVAGRNAKATQVGGMTAASPTCPGNIGLPGVKLLTSLSPPLLGGGEVDHPISGTEKERHEVGCPPIPVPHCTVSLERAPNCQVNKEEAAYNVLANFFYGTSKAADFGGALLGTTAPIQYLGVNFEDVQYANKHPHSPHPPSTIPCNPSLQDLLETASYDLFTMAGQPPPVQKFTCPTGP